MNNKMKNDYFKNTKDIERELRIDSYRKKVLGAYVEHFKKMNYTHFLTLTYKNPKLKPNHKLYHIKSYRAFSTELSRKDFLWFFSHLNSKHQQFYEKAINCHAAWETSTHNRGLHLHVAIDSIPLSLRDKLREKCESYFGNTDIRDVHDGVGTYLGEKYAFGKLTDMEYLRIYSKYPRH